MLNYLDWDAATFFGHRLSVKNVNGNIIIEDRTRPKLTLVVNNTKKDEKK